MMATSTVTDEFYKALKDAPCRITISAGVLAMMLFWQLVRKPKQIVLYHNFWRIENIPAQRRDMTGGK